VFEFDTGEEDEVEVAALFETAGAQVGEEGGG